MFIEVSVSVGYLSSPGSVGYFSSPGYVGYFSSPGSLGTSKNTVWLDAINNYDVIMMYC